MPTSNISFQSEEGSFEIENPEKVASWIKNCVTDFDLKLGELAYVFMDDNSLLRYNQTYLDHDTLTDIITFDYSENSEVSGDILISVERVRENADTFKTSFTNELHRVIIHGVLHLCGFSDKSPEEKTVMREKEDYCLSLRDF